MQKQELTPAYYEMLKHYKVDEIADDHTMICRRCGKEHPYRISYPCVGYGEWICIDCLFIEHQPDEHPPFISITEGVRGYFACLVAWDEECGCYFPCESGIGSYATAAEAIPEAKSWAESCDLRFEE